MALTIKETKNKILASLPAEESNDALVGEVRGGGYIILTEKRVIEIFSSAGKITSLTKKTTGYWEEYEEGS
jgi:hypothetical protein